MTGLRRRRLGPASRALRLSREDAVIPLGGRGLGDAFIHDPPQRGEGTDRIGVGGVAGERERLAAAAAEIHMLPRAGPAGLLHPRVSPERLEAGRLVPD